jgi:hypothetical protein
MTKAFRFSLTAPLVIIITLLALPHAINAYALLTESSIIMTSENSSRSTSVVVVGGDDDGGRRRGSAATMRQRAELPPPSSSSSPPLLPPAYHRIVFSDIDGTLVHYPAHCRVGRDDDARGDAANDADADDNADEEEPIVIRLPPSKTGTRGVISTRTLSLCHRLRHGISIDDNDDDDNEDDGTRIANGGMPFVLVSGMRTTTLFQHLPYLPQADAYVSKSGGGIFYPSPFLTPRSSSDLALQALAEVQQTGGTATFVDTEPATYHCLVQLDCVGG